MAKTILSEKAGVFFYQKLKEAQDKENIELNPFTEFYLMNLMTRLISPPIWQTMPEQQACSLAELYLQSFNCPPAKQADLLRQVGDWCLFLVGFLPDSLSRQLVNEEYYVNLGRQSYGSLAAPGLADYLNLDDNIFIDLANKFILMVNLLAHISEQFGWQKATDLLRIYERWLKFARERDKKILEQAGFVLSADFNKFWH